MTKGNQSRIIIKDLDKPVSGTLYGNKALFDVAAHEESLKPSQGLFVHLADTSTVATTTSYEMNINASGAPVDFFFQNQTSTIFHIVSINMLLMDGSIDPKDFGGINNGISNGISIHIDDTDTSLLLDFTNGLEIKRNAEFGFLAGFGVVREVGTGDDSLNVAWDLPRSGAQVELNQNQRFVVTINDNLSPLSTFQANIQGHYERE